MMTFNSQVSISEKGDDARERDDEDDEDISRVSLFGGNDFENNFTDLPITTTESLSCINILRQDKEQDKEQGKSDSLIELDNINYKDLFMKMIHENQELRKTIVMENQDLRNQITELIPKVGNNNTINCMQNS